MHFTDGTIRLSASDLMRFKGCAHATTLDLRYPARVKVIRGDRGRAGAIVAAVGMQVTADVRTGRRTILSYLLSPIDEAVQKAGKER